MCQTKFRRSSSKQTNIVYCTLRSTSEGWFTLDAGCVNAELGNFLSPCRNATDACGKRSNVNEPWWGIKWGARCTNGPASFLVINGTYLKDNMGAAIAHWICLHLPSCRPGFESQAHHQCFNQFIFEFHIWFGKDKNNHKRGRDWLIFYRITMAKIARLQTYILLLQNDLSYSMNAYLTSDRLPTDYNKETKKLSTIWM